MNIKDKIYVGMKTFFRLDQKSFELGTFCENTKIKKTDENYRYYVQYPIPKHEVFSTLEEFQSGIRSIEKYMKSHHDKHEPFKFLLKD